MPEPLTAQAIRRIDRDHLWHPYAAIGEPTHVVVRSAAGPRLRLAEPFAGRTELVDGMSSWWAAIHGYAHPVLDAAVREQLAAMSHVMFGGLTHEPAARLAARLVALTPAGLDHVFFSDSGSVAVEVAVKMCLQYWRSRGRPGRYRLLTWRGGYHGDTLTPMSLCDPIGGMHRLWRNVLPEQLFVPGPPTEFDSSYLDMLDAVIGAHADELAAIVVEPVVQGAGGMRFHDPRYVAGLRALADEHDVLLVLDEIATGFGRTGAMFAADAAAITPDVLCLGKALTGGYLSMAATLCTAEVSATIARGDVPVLAHGPTFMANPLAAAVADASVGLLLDGDWRDRVADIERGLVDALRPARSLPGVTDVRVLGAIGVVELDRPVDVPAATRRAAERGVWLRPFRNLLYTMPPYVADADDVAAIGAAVCAAVPS